EFTDYFNKRAALETEIKTAEEQFKTLRKGKTGNLAEARRELQRKELQLNRQLSQLEMTHAGAPARANVLLDLPKPVDSPVFVRGEADNKGEVVPRRFLEILSGPTRQPFRNGSGRLELAQAIASRSN